MATSSGANRASTPASASAALVTVSDVAGIKGERKHRAELRQSHEAERERIAGHFIDAPGHGRRENLHRDVGNEAAGEEEKQIAG